MSFRLVLKLVTLNDLERRNDPYLALFHRVNATQITYIIIVSTTQSRDTMSNFATKQDSPQNYLFTAKSDIIQCRIVIVTNYIDISRKMNYNRNRQFRRLIGTIICVYVQHHTSQNLDVYGTARNRLFQYCKGLGFESPGAAEFLVYIFIFNK